MKMFMMYARVVCLLIAIDDTLIMVHDIVVMVHNTNMLFTIVSLFTITPWLFNLNGLRLYNIASMIHDTVVITRSLKSFTHNGV